MFDASLEGYAVVEGFFDRTVLENVVRHQERWRFKQESVRAVGARVRGLQNRDVLTDVATV